MTEQQCVDMVDELIDAVIDCESVSGRRSYREYRDEKRAALIAMLVQRCVWPEGDA